jgi:gas vesicle protein
VNSVSEQDRSHEGLISLLAGISVGAVIGAAAALLLAPQSGAETRSYIGDTAGEMLGKIRDSMDDVRAKLDEVIANTKQVVSRRGETASVGAGSGETAVPPSPPI